MDLMGLESPVRRQLMVYPVKSSNLLASLSTLVFLRIALQLVKADPRILHLAV